MDEAVASGLTHYSECPTGLVDMATDTQKPCLGCGSLLFSDWIFTEDLGEQVEVWSAIARGLVKGCPDSEVANPGWLCDCCYVTLCDL